MVRVCPLKTSLGEEATSKLSTVLLLEVLLSVIVPVPFTTGSLKFATRLTATSTPVALSAGLVVVITGAATAGTKAARAFLSSEGALTVQV